MIRFYLLSYRNSCHLGLVFQVLPQSAGNNYLLAFNQSLTVSFALLEPARRVLKQV